MSYIIDENGNHKRTVRCSHCWEKGHNKGSCPDRKTQLTKRIKDYEASLAKNDYDEHPYQRQRDENYLASTKEELDKMLNKGKGRECSYCANTGHNRRTCQYRKNDIAEHTEKTRVFREKFVEKMSEIGLGVGAIVRKTIRVKDDEVSALAFVESIDWNDMDHRDKYAQGSYYMRCSDILRLRVLGDYIDRWNEKITTVKGSAPPNVVNTDDLEADQETLDRSSSQYPGVQVVSGVDDVHPPSDYFDDKTISKLMIKEIVDSK